MNHVGSPPAKVQGKEPEENFDRAWNRFRTALLYRGYPKEEIAKVENELTWEGRESERRKLRERAEEKKERRRRKEGWGKKGACPGIPICLAPSKLPPSRQPGLPGRGSCKLSRPLLAAEAVRAKWQGFSLTYTQIGR